VEVVSRQVIVSMTVAEAQAHGISIPPSVVGNVQITIDEADLSKFTTEAEEVSTTPVEMDVLNLADAMAAWTTKSPEFIDLVLAATKLVRGDIAFDLANIENGEFNRFNYLVDEAAARPDLTDREGEFVKLCLDMKKASIKRNAGLAAVTAENMRGMLYPSYEVVVADPYAEEPYLYILMRSDMDSLNPGKAVAQGTHAANQLVWEAVLGAPATRKELIKNLQFFADALKNNTLSEEHELLVDWMFAAGGFGTCIVKAVDGTDLELAINNASGSGQTLSNITHDPSYPIKDGQVFFTRPVDTCGYVFGRKKNCQPFVGKFPLMR
jgi:hypothetical protein